MIPAAVELDDLDRRILEVMQDDSSLPNNALAERVHVSAPTCLRRVKRLVDSGVIARQVAIVDPQAVGNQLCAIVEITLDRQGEEHQATFEARVAAEAAIQQCYRVSPGPDFVLIATVRDMASYHALAQRLFAGHANVRNVRAYFAINRSKFSTRLPL